MKKRQTALAAAVLLAALAGCGPEAAQPTPTAVPSPTVSPEPEAQAELIQPLPNTSFLLGMNKYKEIELDQEGIYSVELFTSARQGPDGAFQWDDGQDYALAAKSADGIYPLIPKTYIQLGDVDFTTFYESGTFHVLTAVVQGAGIVQYDFLYRPEEKVFERQVVYEAAGIDSVQRPTVFGTDYLDGYTADPPAITYSGQTDASFGERHILLEEAPENAAEELTALFFYEDIAGRYDRRKALYGAGTTLGQMEDSSERQAEEGVYVREYVLHSLTTVARDGLFPEEFYGFSPQIL